MKRRELMFLVGGALTGGARYPRRAVGNACR
jgi:hypothetical protein